MADSLTAPFHFIFYQAIFAPNSAPNLKNRLKFDFGVRFGAFFSIWGGFIPKMGIFTAIRGIKKCPKHDFQKILCGRKTHFSRMQILIFPASSPSTTLQSQKNPPKKLQKRLPLPHSRHLRPLYNSRKKKEEIPENTIFQCFLIGAGRKPEGGMKEKIRKERSEKTGDG